MTSENSSLNTSAETHSDSGLNEREKVIVISSSQAVMQINESNQSILIKSSISFLKINGDNNRIIIKSSVPQLVIIGNKNKIHAGFYKNSLYAINFQGNDNKIKVMKGSSVITERIGRNNKVYGNELEEKAHNREEQQELVIKIRIKINLNEMKNLLSKKRMRE